MVLIKYEHLKNETKQSTSLPQTQASPSSSPPSLLTKYPSHTTPTKNQQLYDSDDYFKARKKISPFKQIANMTTPMTSCSLCTRVIASSPHHLIANLACTKYFKIFSKYFLFVFMTMFFLLFMVQAYKCVHKFNLNQREVHASLNTLKLNYRRLNYSSHLNEHVRVLFQIKLKSIEKD